MNGSSSAELLIADFDSLVARAEQKQPPGYQDAGKAGDGVSGDYLVWYQILHEAGRPDGGTEGR